MENELFLPDSKTRTQNKATFWAIIAVGLVVLTLLVSIFGGEEILEAQDLLLIPLVGIAIQRWRHWSGQAKKIH